LFFVAVLGHGTRPVCSFPSRKLKGDTSVRIVARAIPGTTIGNPSCNPYPQQYHGESHRRCQPENRPPATDQSGIARLPIKKGRPRRASLFSSHFFPILATPLHHGEGSSATAPKNPTPARDRSPHPDQGIPPRRPPR
jgi:hypothetical protein